MSCGANVRIGFWIELSGSAAARSASCASASARAWSTVTPSWPSNATV
jgi:hypothetical protein